MRVVGIDPGLKGALACLDLETCEARVVDMPTHAFVDGRPVPDVYRIAETLAEMDPTLIILEHVEPRPRAGAVSEWRFGMGFGALTAACQLHGDRHTIHLVRPAFWKKEMGVTSDKKTSLVLARTLFPALATDLARMKDDGRAEALLLCAYHRDHLRSATEMEVF